MSTAKVSNSAARRQAWAQDLIDNRLDDIAAAFRRGDTDPPMVIWNPAPAALRTDMLRFALDHWNALRGTARAPLVSRLDPVELRPVLGYVMLVDPIDGGVDFRYRLYGSLIATVSGVDMTGKLVSQHHASSYVVDFSFAGYLAVDRRPEPLYTLRRPALAEFTRSWERLVLPLLDDAGTVGRFLVVNVPENEAGVTIRPAF